jgi:hypothetical protein
VVQQKTAKETKGSIPMETPKANGGASLLVSGVNGWKNGLNKTISR